MKYGKIVCGNIRYTASDDYTEVESIDGWLDAYGADTPKAFPKLTTIGRWLYIRGAKTRKAFPKLTVIGGWLDVRRSDTRTTFPKLATIAGGLYANGTGTRTAFPNLKTIGRDLYANGAHTLTAFPKLTTIGGWLDVHGANVRKAFPKLTTIGGELYVYGANTRTAFPKLKHKHSNKAKQIARRNLSRSLLKSGYMLQDEILSRHLASRKLANGMIVHTGIIVGKTDKTYVIETPDGVCAHGNTVKQARDSLLYKLSENRDTTLYKAWTLDTSITKRQAIQSYMTITGACAAGTKHFVETRFGDKVPARTTVRKVIEITAGQYGSDVYKEFFENKK